MTDRAAPEREAFCLERARAVCRREAEAIREAEERIDGSFARAVELLRAAVVRPEDREGTGLGKIVVTGIGKSGLVARKIAATFNSTGATAYYLHPVEAIHGDLGMVRPGDVVVAVSRSGGNRELLRLVPPLRLLGAPIILITAKEDSELAKHADETLLIGDGPEACSLNLAPTASVAASLALGDALAITLFDIRGLKCEDFARYHPGGVLGRRILLRVEDLMLRGEEVPLVSEDAPMREVLVEIVEKRVGATAVVDGEGRLAGIVTDGDLKRILLRHDEPTRLRAGEMMNRDPKTIGPGALVAEALKKMTADPRAVLPCLLVTDQNNRPIGFLHHYACLQSGVAD